MTWLKIVQQPVQLKLLETKAAIVFPIGEKQIDVTAHCSWQLPFPSKKVVWNIYDEQNLPSFTIPQNLLNTVLSVASESAWDEFY